MRKALQAEQNKSEMNVKIKNLDEVCYELDKHVDSLNNRIEQTMKAFDMMLQKDERNHKEALDKYRDNLQDYKNELEQILSTPQK